MSRVEALRPTSKATRPPFTSSAQQSKQAGQQNQCQRTCWKFCTKILSRHRLYRHIGTLRCPVLLFLHHNTIMNWTGGRLQRHSLGTRSNTNRSLRAVQKQHFAKKRLAARSGRGSSVSPIKLLGVSAALNYEHDDTSGNGKSGGRTQEKGRFFERDEGGGQLQEMDIEAIRRNLLRRNDWANLSLSRPLKMTFSSTRTERDNLAKRRRLTDRDRARLSAMNDGGEAYTRRISELRRRSSSVFDADAISIRIGQPGRRRAISVTPVSQQILSQDTSNESMLFDGEERHRRTQSILVERSDVGQGLDEESVQEPTSQEMIVSDSECYQAEEEWDVPEEKDQEEPITLTSENSVPLPVLHPQGSFQRNEDGELRYEPPVPHTIEPPAIPSEARENLLISSSPEKTRARRTQVPLWVPEATDSNGPPAWYGTGRTQWQYPWTSKPIVHQPLEKCSTTFRQPLMRASIRNEASSKVRHGSQSNLFINQEGRVSILGVTETQEKTSLPLLARQPDKGTQGKLQIDREGHVSIIRGLGERNTGSSI